MTAAYEHVFRHAGSELIDRPDLPTPTAGVAWQWIATVWPDPTSADGWAALEWERGERGWHLPATLVVGDVIEFGTCGLDTNECAIETTVARWYGWLLDITHRAAIVVGPYSDAPSAAAAARPVIDEIRCDELAPPLDALLDHYNLREPQLRHRER